MHTNELPLRYHIKERNIPTPSKNSYSGVFGTAISGPVEKIDFNPKFKLIKDNRVELHQLPEDIMEELNTQRYGYRMLKMIMGGKIEKSLMSLKSGPLISRAGSKQQTDLCVCM